MHFEFATATRIIFGEGMAATVPDLACTFGARPLVVTGASSERARSNTCHGTLGGYLLVSGEPTVDLVREGARHAQDARCDVVISMGGGSVINADKAIAILSKNASVNKDGSMTFSLGNWS
jgi:alcohol dehydrogenase class IV